MALAERLEGLLQATVLQICREVVPFTDTLSLSGDLHVEADSREVCCVSFRKNDPLKTPSPRAGELASISSSLTGSRQSLVDNLVAEAMKVWYNEGPSPDRKRVQEIRAEFAQDSRKSIAVELGVEAMTKYGQISPETLEAAAQLRRLADHPIVQLPETKDTAREKHERKQKLVATSDYESTPLNAKNATPVKNNNGMYACPECGKEFTFGTNLTRHQRNFHGRPFTRKKNEGKKLELTENNANLMNTLDENDNESTRECTKKTSGETYSCVACEEVFEERTELAQHVKDLHTDNTNHLHSHTVINETPGCHACQVCGQTFSFAYNLQTHINTVHKVEPPSVPEQTYACDSCEMKFSRQSQLVRHTRKVHKMVRSTAGDNIPITDALPILPSSYIPPCTPGPFTTLMHSPLLSADPNISNYRVPQYTDISPPETETLPPVPLPIVEVIQAPQQKNSITCQLCDMSFAFRSNLIRHMKQAHKNQDQKTQIVNMDTPTHGQQKQAKKLASSPRHRHKCPVCHLAFTFRTNLTRHMRKQHNQVPEELRGETQQE